MRIVTITDKAPTDLKELANRLKARALELGFVLAGITPAVEPGRIHRFEQWLEAGYEGQMKYLADRREAYRDPNSVLSGARSILLLALPYSSAPAAKPGSEKSGRIARYAQGWDDYHDVIHRKLKTLKKWLHTECPEATSRGVVDTAPLLEREFAEAAGLGWIGKNTLLLNRRWGSYFFLAALLTDLDLPTDQPNSSAHCGSCTACLSACPTQAFPEPFVLDATRCISYLTIEHSGSVEPEMRNQLDGWLFGCDICQEVCPWNAFSHRQPNREPLPEFVPVLDRMDLRELLEITDEEYRSRFKKTPFWRSRRRGLLRNAILLVGTQQDPAFANRLIELLTDDEPVIRAAAAWALAQIKPADWQTQIDQALASEPEEWVAVELQQLIS